MRELEIQSKFLELLHFKLGYPADSLLLEFPLKDSSGARKRLADLIVQDVARSRFMAVVEFKKEYSEETVKKAFNQTSQYLGLLNQDLPEYVVVGDETAKYKFRVFTHDDEHLRVEIDPAQFPSYEALKSGHISMESERIAQETRQKRDEVRTVCLISSILLLVVLILSVSGVFTPTPTQLGLLAGIIALLLLPNTSKLKGLGIEFERLKKDSDKNG